MLKLSDQNLLRQHSYINGSWVENESKINVDDPATEEVIAQVSDASIDDAIFAVSSAHLAFSAWSAMPVNSRAHLLRAWFDLIIEHRDDLATLLTMEQGKPLIEAKGEVVYGASYIEWFAEEGKRVYGDTISPINNDKRILVLKQPVGVVGAITPWNFPSAMITRKAAAALAVGCTFVGRCASQTPLSALALAELAHRAGIPNGVFNIIVGDDAQGIGEVLTQHPKVAKFTFTGSTQVGKKLMTQCATTVKKMSMELGGNAPFIVFDDANIDEAVQGAIVSKYRNAGQTCVCTNRIYVQQGIAQQFIEKYKTAVASLKVGSGLDEHTNVGPLITNKAIKDIDALVQKALSQGACLELGGQFEQTHSRFYKPTILSGVTHQMDIVNSEIFGPISPIIEFDTEQQVLEMANDTEYGLAAYFYTRDIGRVWRVSEGLNFGMVGVNEGIISNAAAPFGGVKQSGFGREGSKYGLDDYLELKYLCMGGI